LASSDRFALFDVQLDDLAKSLSADVDVSLGFNLTGSGYYAGYILPNNFGSRDGDNIATTAMTIFLVLVLFFRSGPPLYVESTSDLLLPARGRSTVWVCGIRPPGSDTPTYDKKFLRAVEDGQSCGWGSGEE
jgi:hypothetical protein